MKPNNSKVYADLINIQNILIDRYSDGDLWQVGIDRPRSRDSLMDSKIAAFRADRSSRSPYPPDAVRAAHPSAARSAGSRIKMIL